MQLSRKQDKKIKLFSSKFYPQGAFVSGHVGCDIYKVMFKKPLTFQFAYQG